MLGGGRCSAQVEKVGSDETPSWRRLIIRVHFLGRPASN
jgi:hypothetical protein